MNDAFKESGWLEEKSLRDAERGFEQEHMGKDQPGKRENGAQHAGKEGEEEAIRSQQVARL